MSKGKTNNVIKESAFKILKKYKHSIVICFVLDVDGDKIDSIVSTNRKKLHDWAKRLYSTTNDAIHKCLEDGKIKK